MNNIVILHGWRADVHRLRPLYVELTEKGYAVDVPPLPGFNAQDALEEPWQLHDYAEWVIERIESLGWHECVLVGHSFGGQIASYVAIHHPEHISKLVLVASAGIRKPVIFRQRVRRVISLVSPIIKKILPFVSFSALQSSDYMKVDDNMKKTMSNVLKTDLSHDLAKITVPTLIVWGDEDTTTPVALAHMHSNLIPDVQLKIYSGYDHTLPYEAAAALASDIDTFITTVK